MMDPNLVFLNDTCGAHTPTCSADAQVDSPLFASSPYAPSDIEEWGVCASLRRTDSDDWDGEDEDDEEEEDWEDEEYDDDDIPDEDFDYEEEDDEDEYWDDDDIDIEDEEEDF